MAILSREKYLIGSTKNSQRTVRCRRNRVCWDAVGRPVGEQLGLRSSRAIRSIAGIYPVYDLSSYPGMAKAAPAYGLTEAELNKRLDEFNPIARAGVLAKAKLLCTSFMATRTKSYHLEANSAALAAKYREAGAESFITVNVIKPRP